MTIERSTTRKSSLQRLLLIAPGGAVITVLITFGVFYLAGWLTFAPENRLSAFTKIMLDENQ